MEGTTRVLASTRMIGNYVVYDDLSIQYIDILRGILYGLIGLTYTKLPEQRAQNHNPCILLHQRQQCRRQVLGSFVIGLDIPNCKLFRKCSEISHSGIVYLPQCPAVIQNESELQLTFRSLQCSTSTTESTT